MNGAVVADAAFGDASHWMLLGGTKADAIVFEDGVEYIGAALLCLSCAKEVEFPSTVKRIDAKSDHSNDGNELGMFPRWIKQEEQESTYFGPVERVVTIRSMDCEIADFSNTLGYTFGGDYSDTEWMDMTAELSEKERQFIFGDLTHITIRAYEGSTAEAYAKKYGYTFESLGEAPQTETLAPTLRGDVDGSGVVDVSDAVLLARFVVEDSSAEITDQGLANADADSSGKVDSEDVIRIVKMIAKLV